MFPLALLHWIRFCVRIEENNIQCHVTRQNTYFPLNSLTVMLTPFDHILCRTTRDPPAFGRPSRIRRPFSFFLAGMSQDLRIHQVSRKLYARQEKSSEK